MVMPGDGDDVFVVDVGHDADDAARLVADADELHDAVGPAHLAIERVLAGEERLGDALADDHDAFGAVLVGVAEIAAFEQRESQSVEESGRDGAELRAQIVLAILAGRALHGEGEADVRAPGRRARER